MTVHAHPANRPSGPASRAQAQQLIRSLTGTTLAYFAEREREQLQRIRDHLMALSDGKVTQVQSQNLRTAANLMDRKAAIFLAAYRKELQVSLSEEIRSALPDMESLTARPAASDNALDGMSLSLIDMQEVDKILLLDRVAQRFNARYENLISPITQQITHLFDLETATPSNNPFQPIVFARAFQNAWEKCGFDDNITEDLMLGLVPEHSINLVPLYEQIGEALTVAGASTEVVHRIRRSPGGTPGPGPGDTAATGMSAQESAQTSPQAALHSGSPVNHQADPPPQGQWSAMLPLGRSLATQARAFLHRIGIGASRKADAPDASQHMYGPQEPLQGQHVELHAPADAGLMNYLGDIQAHAVAYSGPQIDAQGQVAHHNVLRELRERDEVRSAPELDRGTVDALAEVFDYVFADQAIPMQMKVIIGRLQIPVLKAAMIDRDFFLSSEHPARKLVDTLAKASVTWAPEKGENDPLYVQIESTVQRVLTEFEDDLALFSGLLADFTEFLFENEQQVSERIEPVATEERSREALAFALAHADELVHAHFADIPLDVPLAPFLTPFLTVQWRQVIANAWLRDQDAALESLNEEIGTSGSVPLGETNAVATQAAEDPQASEPQGTANDGPHCDAAVKTMRLLIWSTQPKASSESRRELVGVLPDLVRALNTGLDEIRWDGEPRAKFTKRMIAVHMLAIRMKGPSVPDTQSAALEESESRQAMEALDQRRADKLAGSVDEFDDAAHALTRGLWFAISEKGKDAYKCRLSWVSPLRTRFLFTNRDGYEAFVRNEREVAAMLRLGTLTLLDQAPIVSRAIDRLMADNDPDIQLSA